MPALLGLDLAILLDMDMVVGLEDADFVFGELDAGKKQSVFCAETEKQ